ncbi:MAG TPA: HD-GYP domain-containing protein [Firmicutes bacterium]|jgi:HD-GYP domain-containing protein (c-di-GMP phosphodiesterase class II)|nr:HD-GYP domain-containing protein [Bacillota bacterium]
MKGVHIGRESDFIKQARKKSTEIRLLAKGNGIEVMKQYIAPNSHITLTCEPDWNGFEFYFILDGALVCRDEKGRTTRLRSGDYIAVTHLMKDVYFRTETGVTLLYMSSQPVFHALSDEIQGLVALAREVERKDSHTQEHCERIQSLSMLVGERMKLPPDRLELLIYAALLHDIGKIGIPNYILKKSGPLTREEWQEIEKHPSAGRAIIEKTFLRDAGPIIEQHHERCDGTGYPFGLKGDEILIEARIIAVVDAFDAMSSDRPYRKALTNDEVIAELRRCSGTQFDPKVVEVLIDVVSAYPPGVSFGEYKRF